MKEPKCKGNHQVDSTHTADAGPWPIECSCCCKACMVLLPLRHFADLSLLLLLPLLLLRLLLRLSGMSARTTPSMVQAGRPSSLLQLFTRYTSVTLRMLVDSITLWGRAGEKSSPVCVAYFVWPRCLESDFLAHHVTPDYLACLVPWVHGETPRLRVVRACIHYAPETTHHC